MRQSASSITEALLKTVKNDLSRLAGIQIRIHETSDVVDRVFVMDPPNAGVLDGLDLFGLVFRVLVSDEFELRIDE